MPRAKLAAEIHLIVFDLIVTDSGCWPFLEMFPIPQSPTPSHLDGRPCLLVVFFILSLRGFASTLLHRNIFCSQFPTWSPLFATFAVATQRLEHRALRTSERT